MPEDGWTSLTVGEHVSAMVKALARSQRLLGEAHSCGRELKVGEEDWMECSICGTRLKAKNMPEHTSKVHRGGH
jgi:rRNA maturation endonuclease Nob1